MTTLEVVLTAISLVCLGWELHRDYRHFQAVSKRFEHSHLFDSPIIKGGK